MRETPSCFGISDASIGDDCGEFLEEFLPLELHNWEKLGGLPLVMSLIPGVDGVIVPGEVDGLSNPIEGLVVGVDILVDPSQK